MHSRKAFSASDLRVTWYLAWRAFSLNQLETLPDMKNGGLFEFFNVILAAVAHELTGLFL